jgi:16S rRNA (cytosine967-C5)-methyltransferase
MKKVIILKIDFARELALKILYKVEEENGYSNLVLDEYINENREKLTFKDINLISEIVYGTISWKLTIDAIIEKYSKVKLNKISKWVKIILRMGIYQIVFLDKIPKSAAVNESVNLCKKYGFKSANFVNAVLRKVEKEDYEKMKQIEDNFERISKMYSMPKWMVEKFVAQYGEEKAEEICKNSLLRPDITIRVNTLKTTLEEVEQLLNERKIKYEKSKLENFIHLKNIKNVSNMDLFIDGYFTVQDEGAGKIAYVLNPKPEEKVLDACSAPGGKTTHIAELMQNKGEILAWDVYDHRLKLVEDNANRLGINIIKTEKNDATFYNKKYDGMFDKILLDVPCLGIGVLRRKPDIKWQKKEEDISAIKSIQKQILDSASNYLKAGGELVYSTCSILREENEEIIEKFIREEKNGKFEIITQENILPSEKSDGFFICKLRKKL